EVVAAALEGEGGAVGGQARPARVVGHAATKSRGHGGGAERAAAGRGGHRRRGRRRAVQGEADGRAREGVAGRVRGRRLDGVGAVGLRRPGGHRGAAGPGRGRAAGGGGVAGRQVEDRRLPGRARPVVVVRG